jgi:hypothetical protein
MTQYLVYRHGSNAANQPMRDRAPVAIVEARTRDDATACAYSVDDPRIADHAYCILARHVSVWANQRLSAVPVSRAPKADVREVQETDLANYYGKK